MPKITKSFKPDKIYCKSENQLDIWEYLENNIDEEFINMQVIADKKQDKELQLFTTTAGNDSKATIEQEKQQEKQFEYRENQKYKQVIEDTQEFLMSQMGQDMESAWSKTAERSGVLGWVLQNEETKKKNQSISRAIAEIPGTVDQILQIITARNLSKILNPGEVLNVDLLQIDDQTKIKLVRAKAPIVDDRYVLIVQEIQYLNNGGIQIIESTVEYNDFDKSYIKNAINAKIKQIWILKPLDAYGINNSISIELLSILDPGGIIPSFIKNTVIKKLAYDKLCDILKYQLKIYKKHKASSAQQLKLYKSQ